MEYVNHFNKKIQVLDEAEIIVIGGGTAGSVVAISALLENKSCIIIEKSNALGGTATNGLVIPFMGSHVSKMDGLNVSLNEEYTRFDKKAFYNGRKNAIFANPVTYAMFYDQKVRELNGKIYYGATFLDAITDKNNKIQYVIAFIHNEFYAIKGKCFLTIHII